MNILNKVALQGLKKNRTRTVVTIIGVILSVAMITAVATFGVSLLSYMADGAAKKYGNWHVAFLDVDSSFVQERMNDKEVLNTVTFDNIGYALVDGTKNPNKPYFFVAGFNQKTFDALPITLLSGRLPENSSEIVISGKVTTNSTTSYAVGNTLSIAVGSRMNGNERLGQNNPYTSEIFVPQEERNYTIVGVCQTPAFEEDFSPGYTLITRTDTTDLVNELSLFITLKNPRKVYSYVDKTVANHAYILNNYILRFMGLDATDKIFNALLYSVGGIVVAIIMIGSIFLIYNSFSISLNERTQQIGILSSVGATSKQLRNSVLFEGACIGVIGIPIGIVVGIVSIGFVISVVDKNFESVLYTNVPLTLNVSVFAIVGAATVSIITILISAYIPARKSANTPVMECIRQTNEVKVGYRVVRTSKLTQSIYGLEGILALKNFKRNKKRYRSIVLSLVLSVVLFISTSAFVIDLKQASEQAKVVTDYDIGFGTQDMSDSEMLQLYDKLKNTNGVYESSYQTFTEYLCTVSASELSDAYWETTGEHSLNETVDLKIGIQFIDDNAYMKFVNDLGLTGNQQSGKMIVVAKMESDKNDVKGVTDLSDMFINSSMDFTIIPQTTEETKIAQDVSAKFIEFMPLDTPPMMGGLEQRPYYLQGVVPWSLKEKFISSDTIVKGLTFKSRNPSQSVAEMKRVIESEKITPTYILLDTSEMLEESQNYIFIANVFAYTFIIMISLIAVANVFNTISTNIKLRRRELAMLRSVGMSDKDFNKMMCFECIFYGVRALLFGLPLAILSSWLIYKGMLIGGADNLNFVLPWFSIGVSVFSVFSVIFITMLYAVSKIRRENIIDALRDDMT